MRELEKPISRVFVRLRFQRFLSALVWALAMTLLAVAIVLGVNRASNLVVPGPEWMPFAVAAGLASFVSALVAVFTGPSRLDATVAIDRAFKLNERLSSALALPTDLRETPAGQALLSDTVHKLNGLDVGSAFGMRLPRRSWLVLIPATLAVSMVFLPAWVEKRVLAKTETKVDTKALTKQAQALTKKISSQRQALEKDKFPETEKLLAQIEKKAEDMAKSPPAQKDKLLVEMNKLTDALKERKKQIGSPEQVNRQLQQLKEMGQQGPADQMAKEMARGDFKKAAEQIKQLKEKLEKGQMTPAEKKAVQEQLGEMAKKLKDLANMEERKKQLDEALKNGGLSKEQHEREMEKLKEQSKSLQQLQQLAGKLSQAEEALKKGDTKEAAKSMGMTQQQFEDMAKQLEEMQSIESAMADVMDAKNGMNNDGMNQLGQMFEGMGSMESMKPGNNNGMGRGRGRGDRPEAPDETATYTTRVQQQLRKGKAVLQGFTQPSKTIKGESVIDIQGELDAASASSEAALSNQRIPKSVEKHIRAYYDQLNKGK